MMRKNVIFLLLTLATLNLFAKTSADRIDPRVEDKFKKEFGSSIKASWQIIQDISIATFTEAGEEKQVYYYSDGEILGFGKIISRDLLPEAIGRSINTRFNSELVQTVYEFKSKESPTSYYVRLVNQRHSILILANEFGDIVICQKTKSKLPH